MKFTTTSSLLLLALVVITPVRSFWRGDMTRNKKDDEGNEEQGASPSSATTTTTAASATTTATTAASGAAAVTADGSNAEQHLPPAACQENEKEYEAWKKARHEFYFGHPKCYKYTLHRSCILSEGGDDVDHNDNHCSDETYRGPHNIVVRKEGKYRRLVLQDVGDGVEKEFQHKNVPDMLSIYAQIYYNCHKGCVEHNQNKNGAPLPTVHTCNVKYSSSNTTSRIPTHVQRFYMKTSNNNGASEVDIDNQKQEIWEMTDFELC